MAIGDFLLTRAPDGLWLNMSLLNIYLMSLDLSSQHGRILISPIDFNNFDSLGGLVLGSAHEAGMHRLPSGDHPHPGGPAGGRRGPVPFGQYLWRPRCGRDPVQPQRRLRGPAEDLRGAAARIRALEPQGPHRPQQPRGERLPLKPPLEERRAPPLPPHPAL